MTESPQISESDMKIEPTDEVHYLSTERSVLAFRIPENVDRTEEDPGDEFYDLTLNDVKAIFKDLQKTRISLEETPLLTKKHRDEAEKERAISYSQTVIRVEFPDRTVLQGMFSPTDSVATVVEVVSSYLSQPMTVTLFTAPPKVILSAESTLEEAKLVPTGKVYFKGVELTDGKGYLRDDVLQQLTSHKGACQAAALARSSHQEVKMGHASDETAPKQPQPQPQPIPKSSSSGTGKGAAKILKFLSKPSVSSNLKKS